MFKNRNIKGPDSKWTMKPLAYRECNIFSSTTIWSLINLSNNLQITDVKLTGL